MIKIPAIELISVDELKSDQQNPNRMTKRQHKRLKTSMKKYGFIVPIITNKDLVFADGEQRWIIAKELGMKQVPVIRLPVKDVDRRLLRQVLNKLRGEHDLIADAYEFEKIIAAGEEDDLKHLLDLSDSRLERYLLLLKDFKESPTPPLRDTNIKHGEVFQLGKHRLMCGDSTNIKDIEILMKNKKADALFTDPPYGINYLPNGDRHGLKKLGRLKSDGDYRKNPREFPVIRDSLPLIAKTMREGAPLYVCTSWQEIGLIVDSLMKEGCHVYSVIVWDRVMPRITRYPQDYVPVNEFIVYGWRKGKKRTYNMSLRNERKHQLTTIWRFQTLRGKEMTHITEKPVELSRNAIVISSQKNSIVADFFGGSGSTLIACEQTERICYIMEIDPRYCQVIIDRWENYTRQKAEQILD